RPDRPGADAGGGADRQDRRSAAGSCDRGAAAAVPGDAGAARRARPRLSRDRRGDQGADRHRDVAAGARPRPPARRGRRRRAKGQAMTSAPPDPTLLLHAWLAGELDPAPALELEQRLAADPALAAERDRIAALRLAIGEKLPREAAPPALARRIEAAVG